MCGHLAALKDLQRHGQTEHNLGHLTWLTCEKLLFTIFEKSPTLYCVLVLEIKLCAGKKLYL